jgi:transposase
MENTVSEVSLPSIILESAEGMMLKEDEVREVLSRIERGEKIKAIARELGVDRKTVKRWRRLGGWRAQKRKRRRKIDSFSEFVKRRGPEVDWNAVVLYRELSSLGFGGTYQQVQRFVQPYRSQSHWENLATVRFETGPGEQAQVDFGETKLWIGEKIERVHLFAFTLGYSRRIFSHAYHHERLSSLIDGHERALRHFGGVPLSCLYDNPRTLVLGRSEGKVLWHPRFEDFARYWGFTPRACRPYRAQTKGKIENGVKYVKRNALAGRRFGSWEALNEWLLTWCVTVADQRIHGTTHEKPIERFVSEGLTAFGSRERYRYEQILVRKVPADCLVSIAAARYSVPVKYVGQTVSVHESATHFEIFHDASLIARHEKSRRHSVVMDPEHYRGLLRAGRNSSTQPPPPQWDPAYLGLGEVAVRNLAVYDTIARCGGES